MMASAQSLVLERTPSCIESTPQCSDWSTRQTVELMTRHIRRASGDANFRRLADQVRARWSTGPVDLHTAWACFWFCKHLVHFKNDEEAVAALFNAHDEVDFLIEPRLLVQVPRPEGDCDEFTMLVCALLQCNRIPWEIVTLACDPFRPGLWSHVYARAALKDGRQISLDASNGAYPGWEVPARDITRKAVWGMNGQPIDSPAASTRDLRMHAYVRPRRRRGMGQDGGYIDPETGLPVQFGNQLPSFTAEQTGSQVTVVGNASTGAGLSPQDAAVIAQALKSATQLAQMVLLPSGSYVTPQGLIVKQVPGAVPTTVSTGFNLSGISGTTIMLGAAVLGLILVMGKR